MSRALHTLTRASLLSLGLFCTASTFAAQPNTASLAELAQLMHIEDSFAKMIQDGINPQMIQQLVDANLKQTLPEGQSITPEQLQALSKAIEQFTQKSLNAVNTPEFRNQLKQAFVQSAQMIYTQEEVNAMIDFYDNAIGQSIIKKQPALMQDYMGKFMPIMMQKQQDVLMSELPAFMAEIESILNLKDQ